MFANLTGWHALLILAVILLLFGAAKLPALARSMGQSARVLKTELRSDRDDSGAVAGLDRADGSARADRVPAPSSAQLAPPPH